MTVAERSVARVVGAAAQLRGELQLPSDKSIAHRALLFNAMAKGSSTVLIRRPGADVRSTADALALIGALEGFGEDHDGLTRFSVLGGGTRSEATLPGGGDERLLCGNSGTTIRLLTGALAGRHGRTATLLGDASLSRRPMERVAAPLRSMGAEIATTGGRLPMRVRGQRPLIPMAHRLPVSSAQVVGAICLAAMAANGRTTVETPGPTRDHTERLLAWLGARIRRQDYVTTIDGPVGISAHSLSVPGDLSCAAAWLVAASIHRDARLHVRDVGLNPSRLAVVNVLREMGADIEIEPVAGSDDPEPSGHLRVTSPGTLRSIVLSGPGIAELIDELPLLAVAMASANGTSELRDAAELRVKESDRITLVVRNLRAIGVRADELPDGWRIQGVGGARSIEDSSLGHAIGIETAGDHRIAISFAIAATAGLAPAVVIDDSDCVDVSYPGFWEHLSVVTGASA